MSHFISCVLPKNSKMKPNILAKVSLLFWLFIITFAIYVYCCKRISKEPPYLLYFTVNISDTNQTCHKRNSHIYYLKVHKTGSSTISTVLSKIGMRSNKNMCSFVDANAKQTMSERVLIRPGDNIQDQAFDILVEHTFYNKKDVSHILSDNRFQIASLRHPLRHSHSYFKEFSIAKELNLSKSDPVSEFLVRSDLGNKKTSFSNLMIREFGISQNSIENHERLEDFTKLMMTEFDLIMIMERFNTSMVLLKRKLCLEMSDILYLIQRQQKDRKLKRYEIDPDLKNIHREINHADYYLYEMALHHLEDEISAAGPGLKKEVEMFEKLEHSFVKYCDPVIHKLMKDARVFTSLVNSSDSIVLDPQPWGKPFTVGVVDCAFLKLKTVVIKILLYIKSNRYICQDPEITRIPASLITIQWEGRHKIYLNQVYCSVVNKEYDLPLELFSIKEAYMIYE